MCAEGGRLKTEQARGDLLLPVLCCITWTQRSRLPGVRLGRRSWVLRSNRSGHEIGVLVGIGGHVIAVFGCWCLDLEIWA